MSILGIPRNPWFWGGRPDPMWCHHGHLMISTSISWSRSHDLEIWTMSDPGSRDWTHENTTFGTFLDPFLTLFRVRMGIDIMVICIMYQGPIAHDYMCNTHHLSGSNQSWSTPKRGAQKWSFWGPISWVHTQNGYPILDHLFDPFSGSWVSTCKVWYGMYILWIKAQ